MNKFDKLSKIKVLKTDTIYNINMLSWIEINCKKALKNINCITLSLRWGISP